jgi:Skp family chaperone for outer membrane proteins
MKRISVLVTVLTLLPALLQAQAAAPAAAQSAPAADAKSAPSRVAVIDFQRAITENAEGKKAAEKLMAEVTKRQTEFDTLQKSVEEKETRLRTQGNALNETTRATLTREIDEGTTKLTRLNEDGQKALGELQQVLFRPIAERTNRVVNTYASQAGFAVIFDASSQASSIIFMDPVADITTEIIRLVDADAAKTPTAAAAPK